MLPFWSIAFEDVSVYRTPFDLSIYSSEEIRKMLKRKKSSGTCTSHIYMINQLSKWKCALFEYWKCWCQRVKMEYSVSFHPNAIYKMSHPYVKLVLDVEVNRMFKCLRKCTAMLGSVVILDVRFCYCLSVCVSVCFSSDE